MDGNVSIHGEVSLTYDLYWRIFGVAKHSKGCLLWLPKGPLRVCGEDFRQILLSRVLKGTL